MGVRVDLLPDRGKKPARYTNSVSKSTKYTRRPSVKKVVIRLSSTDEVVFAVVGETLLITKVLTP